jgi:predicted PhzF superfamily epimerase YddE/YHI9
MHHFRIVNVFSIDSDRFSGNPLCVFEDARGLTDVQMQALARQMNLSDRKMSLPLEATLRQGDQVGRPSRLALRVEPDGAIYVSGAVIELGRGFIQL